jgi:hypothetical protein
VRRFRVVVLATLLFAPWAVRPPASVADEVVMELNGSVRFSPGLSTTPAMQNIVMAAGTVIATSRGSVVTASCTFSGFSDAPETIDGGIGHGALDCYPFYCPVQYTRSGIVWRLQGGPCGDNKGVLMTLHLSNTQSLLPPYRDFAATGTVVYGSAGGPASPSTQCTSGTVYEGSTAGLYVMLRMQSVNPTTTRVCLRADNGLVRYGWLITVTGASSPRPPTSDANYSTCSTSPNAVPGEPLVGQFGDAGGPVYVPYYIHAYSGPGISGTGEVWVCVMAGTVRQRVIVPTSMGSGLPTVTMTPDPGSPTWPPS